MYMWYNDNYRQRTNSNNLGVKRSPKCSTSPFKLWLDQKYMSTNGRNNSDDRQGHIDIWRDETITRQTAIHNGNEKGDLWPRIAYTLEVSTHIGNKRGKNDHGNLVFQAKKGQNHGKGNKIQSQNLCTRWNAGERHKLMGNVCPSSTMDES